MSLNTEYIKDSFMIAMFIQTTDAKLTDEAILILEIIHTNQLCNLILSHCMTLEIIILCYLMWKFIIMYAFAIAYLALTLSFAMIRIL